MSQANLLQSAKQGDADAIAALMNDSLQDRGVTATVIRIEQFLHISFTSDRLLNQTTLVEFTREGLETLAIAAIQTVKIYGLKVGEKVPSWTTLFELGNAKFPAAAVDVGGPLELPEAELLVDSESPASQPALLQPRLPLQAYWQRFLDVERRPKIQLPKINLPAQVGVVSYGAIAAVVMVVAFVTGSIVAKRAISKNENSVKPIAPASPVPTLTFKGQTVTESAAQSIAEQQAEVKQYLNRMARTQQIFYQKNARFAANLEELERSAAVISHSYHYTYKLTLPTDTQTHLIAIPNDSRLAGYAAIVGLEKATSNSVPGSLLCEARQSSNEVLTALPVLDDLSQCPIGLVKSY